MIEAIECHYCSRPGWLQLEADPPVMHHGGKHKPCDLPPRDIKHDEPMRRPFRSPATLYREQAS